MLDKKEIKKIARARLKDAEVLAASRRYEGAIYICGYAVELGLKARICKTLKWFGYPSSNNEFKGYRSFKTHNLDVLLHLTGIEDRVKTALFKVRYYAACSRPISYHLSGMVGLEVTDAGMGYGLRPTAQ
jgi:hypothetical protein